MPWWVDLADQPTAFFIQVEKQEELRSNVNARKICVTS
jgi:hypothetical protein